MVDGQKIIEFPVKFVTPDMKKSITEIQPWQKTKNQKCKHINVEYIVDPSEKEVECGACGTKLNPIWVLQKLAANDSRYQNMFRLYLETKEDLKKRVRTKCLHCGKMTPIKTK